MLVLDETTLRRLQADIGGEPNVMAELIATFLRDAPRMIALMRDGLAAGNLRDLNRAAHTVKSTAAIFGAGALSQMCRELEADSKREMPPDAAPRVEAIAAEMARVEADLRAYKP